MRIVSDLHLEFFESETVNPEDVLPRDDRDKDAVLLLAGDIVTMNKLDQYMDFFRDVLSRFRTVCYIMGNHEYYHCSFESVEEKIQWLSRQDLPGNLTVMQDGYLTINDVHIWGGTLWTDMDDENSVSMMLASGAMPEFRGYVEYGGGIFRPDQSADLHCHSRDKILNFLQETDGKKVVMTHHAPSYQSIHQKFKGSQLNPAFASELDGMINRCGPDLWVHGHMHDAADYKIGDTRILCNPLGYRHEQGNNGFQKKLFVKI